MIRHTGRPADHWDISPICFAALRIAHDVCGRVACRCLEQVACMHSKQDILPHQTAMQQYPDHPETYADCEAAHRGVTAWWDTVGRCLTCRKGVQIEGVRIGDQVEGCRDQVAASQLQQLQRQRG